MTASRILFIDTAVSDIGVLLGNLQPDAEAVLLDGTRPAPEQMETVMRDRRGLREVHIMAHGEPGEVWFAAGRLSADTLEGHAAALASLGRALCGGGVHLWSCRTGRGSEGKAFLAAFSKIVGAPVMAATYLASDAATM